MTQTLTLILDFPRDLQHPLFRAATQLIIGVEQQHSHDNLERYVALLRKELRVLSSGNFKEVQLTEDVRRSIKAEAHKLWFDTLNPYYERVGLSPETVVDGKEEQTVRDYVHGLLDPLIENHQQAVKEIERLRAELATRPARLTVVKDAQHGQ